MTSQISATRTWIRALKYFDAKDLDRSLYAFEMTPRDTKTYFNLSMVHVALGDLTSAVGCLQDAVSSGSASALEYFQFGVLLFSLEDYTRSHQNFTIAYLLMDGYSRLNYKNVGLDFILYSCEVLFNCAMCLLHLGKFEEGRAIYVDAQEQQQYPSQVPSSLDIFSIPISNWESGQQLPTRAGYWTVFQVPGGTLFRPATHNADVGKAFCKTESLQVKQSIGEKSFSDEAQSIRKSPLAKIFHISKKKSTPLFKLNPNFWQPLL